MATEDGRAKHEQRERADSFGAVASEYDRFRQSYPAELIDHLCAAIPAPEAAAILDVGCGTGKLGQLFVERGYAVTGVEPDPLMAEVGVVNGLDVEVGKFETWQPAGRRFDLIVAGTSWHWVDPDVGAAVAYGSLKPGGMLGLTWQSQSFEPAARVAIDAAYETFAPEAIGLEDEFDPSIFGPLLKAPWVEPANDWFQWSQTYDADDWLNYLATTSVHVLMPDDVRTRLFTAIREAIADNGGSMIVTYDTVLLSAQRVRT